MAGNPTEALLVVRCQQHDKKAYEELIELWQKRLFYYIQSSIGDQDTTWDILQAVWLTVIQKLSQLRDPRTFPKWLYRIAHNHTISWIRRERRFVSLNEACVPGDAEEVVAGVPWEANVSPERLHQAILQLAPHHRQVVTLHFLESFSVAETADIIGVPEGTVKSRLHHAKDKLRETLKGA